MKKVTDASLLEELEGKQPSKVTDPNLIAELEGTNTSQEQQPTPDQIRRSSVGNRFLTGLAEPLIGAGQLLAHGISAGEEKDTFLGDLADSVDSHWQEQFKKQEEAKQATDTGVDIAGFMGNVLSPANAFIAAKGLPVSMALNKAATGAIMGAETGAIQPVLEGDYGINKAAQVGLGTASGAAFSALMGKISENIARRLNKEPEFITAARANEQANNAVSAALDDVGANQSIPSTTLANLKADILANLKNNKEIDGAALLRKYDFDALGIQPTRGQLTRDPAQYSKEQNLRGAIPEIATLLHQQQQVLRNKFGQLAGEPSNNYQAGKMLSESLKSYDDQLQGNVRTLYNEARQSAGKDLDIPMKGLAQDYAQILDDYGDAIPAAVRKKFEDYGLLTGKQLKVFSVEDADKLLKVINKHDGSIDKARNSALSELRNAVKGAVTSVDDSGGVFAPAVKAAAQRFKLQEEVPALGSVASDRVKADDFVNKFLINGKTDDVNKLASILDAQSTQEARAQIGAYIQRAAFGENPAKDAPIRPETLAKAIRSIGPDKLKAFFTNTEIDDFNRLVRVAAYIDKDPAAAYRNRSNTTVAALSESPIIKSLFGGWMDTTLGRVVGGAAKAATGAVKNSMAAADAMNAKIPTKATELTPKQKAVAMALINASGVIGGSLGAGFAK